MSKSQLRGQRLLNWGLGVTWMATPNALQTMLNVVSAAAEVDLGVEGVQVAFKTTLEESEAVNFTELLSENGRNPDYTRNPGFKIVNQVAIIPIEGTIYRYADMFTDLCGGVTTETLSKDIRNARNDPNVSAIVLHIDSPGGEAYAIGELAHQIRATNTVKPVIAYGDGDVCSAAYYLAVGAGRVVVSPSAFVGCIGTIAVVRNPELDEGKVKPYINVVSTQSPKKVPDLSSEEGMQQIKTSVDDLAAEFILDVATFRGTTVENVTENFGQGDILIGRKALAAGMVDAVGTLDSVLEEIYASRETHESRKVGTSMAKEESGILARMKKWLDGGEDPQLAEAMENLPLGMALHNPAPAPVAPPIVEAAPVPVVIREVVPQEDPEKEELRRKVAAYEAAEMQNAATAKENKIKARIADAEIWARAEILSGRSLPAEESFLTGAYIDAASDDDQMGPFTATLLQENGEPATDNPNFLPTRVERLTARHAARPSREYTGEEVPVIAEGTDLRILLNNVETPREDPSAPYSIEEKRAALMATDTGRKRLAMMEKEAKEKAQ